MLEPSVTVSASFTCLPVTGSLGKGSNGGAPALAVAFGMLARLSAAARARSCKAWDVCLHPRSHLAYSVGLLAIELSLTSVAVRSSRAAQEDRHGLLAVQADLPYPYWPGLEDRGRYSP